MNDAHISDGIDIRCLSSRRAYHQMFVDGVSAKLDKILMNLVCPELYTDVS
jgi:hypothetical protein